MKKINLFILACVFFIITGCSNEKYSLKEKEVVIEVKTYTLEKENENEDIKFFDPLSYLQINEKDLTDKQKENVVANSNVDCDKVGDYEISYKRDDKDIIEPLKVKIVDTTKAKISLTETEFQEGTDIKEKVEVSDNYDEVDSLKENLVIEGYDSEIIGEQEITISVKDSSENETVEKFKITLIEDAEETETPIEDQNYNINDIPYAPGNSGSGSSSGSSGAGSSSGGSSSSGSSGGGWTPPPVVEPTPPVVACPGGNDPDLPCDFIFAGTVGNGGLYDSYIAAEDALRRLGLTAQTNPISSIHYNDGRIKHTFNY